jgi:hypothetical protein
MTIPGRSWLSRIVRSRCLGVHHQHQIDERCPQAIILACGVPACGVPACGVPARGVGLEGRPVAAHARNRPRRFPRAASPAAASRTARVASPSNYDAALAASSLPAPFGATKRRTILLIIIARKMNRNNETDLIKTLVTSHSACELTCCALPLG